MIKEEINERERSSINNNSTKDLGIKTSSGGNDVKNVFLTIINETNREKLNLVDDSGLNILHYACKEGHKEIILEIIEVYEVKNKNIEIISKPDNKLWTPIFYAIDISESGFPDIVDLLLKKGLDPNKGDIKGITPLHLASYKGQDDNVEILLRHKANPNIKDISGRNPLNYAIMEGQTNSVNALLEGGTDLKAIDNNGDSLIHYAITCKGNALLYVIMLAEKGIDVNSQNLDQNTPLNLCALNGAKENIRIIQKLIEFKADPLIKNSKGECFYSLLSSGLNKDSLSITNDGVDEKELSNATISHDYSKLFWYLIFPLLVLIISVYYKTKI